jgi:hypothetical protein
VYGCRTEAVKKVSNWRQKQSKFNKETWCTERDIEMKTYLCQMKTGIVRMREFERKGLATYGVDVSLKCDHECTYCSTPVMIRAHKVFKQLGLSVYTTGYAVIDPDTPSRVAHDVKHIKSRGIVQLCSISNAWAPEAQQCLHKVQGK